MFCVKCGKEIESGADFCTNCGAKAEAEDKKVFDPLKIVSAAVGNVSAMKSNKKLLVFAGGVLAIILILVIVIVVAAVNAKKPGGAASGKNKGDAYFDRPLSVGQIVEFGEYEQDGNTANGKEPIKWRVVSAENDRYLLMSVNVLDYQAWDDGSASGDSSGLDHGSQLLYQNSSIRKWLNDYFDTEAFGEKERKYIIPVSFRNDVITVDKNNQYGKDLAFLMNGLEIAQNLSYYKNAMVSLRLLKDGTYNCDDFSDVKDYSNTGRYGTWYVRDTDKYSKKPTVFYWDMDNSDAHEYTGVSPSEKNGIRPAVYISSDACYKETVEINEKLGSAVDKMSEYQGKYSGPVDNEGDNRADLIIKQGFFDINCGFGGLPKSLNEDLEFLFIYMQDIGYVKRYNMSDYVYELDGSGNDCFTDYNNGMRFIYDSKNDSWDWYLNLPQGTPNLAEGKADQWLLYFKLVPEARYNELKGKS